MSLVKYDSLSALSPIKLKYEYYRNEPVVENLSIYQEGFRFYTSPIFEGFKDFVVNKGNALILTDTLPLSSFFAIEDRIKNDLLYSATLKLSPKGIGTYAYVDTKTNQILLGATIDNAASFNLDSIGGDQVNIMVNDSFLQVQKTYPYTISLGIGSINDVDAYTRQFSVNYVGGYISFTTQTDQGIRYLKFGTDNVLRATGLSFGADKVNVDGIDIYSYVFNAGYTVEDITNSITDSEYFRNDWVTYYMNLENKQNNNNTEVNKVINNPPTNFLASLAVQDLFSNDIVNVNLANLKTGYTPTVAPAIIDNLVNN